MHWAAAPPGFEGPRITAALGVKVTLPLASGAPAVKVVPAQAVPALPVPLCTVKTPVSISPPVHVPGFNELPHDGVWVMLDTATFSVSFGLVALFVMVSDVGTPVCPAVTEAG